MDVFSRRLGPACGAVRVLLLVCGACIIGLRPLAAQPGNLGGTPPPTPVPAQPIPADKAEQKTERAARVVFLNLDRSALGTLLQAKLRDKKFVNAWPPGASHRLLRDIELSPAIDVPPPNDEEENKPPLPDAMILLRTRTGGESSVADLVVCDPNLGLRLGSKRLALTKNLSKDVETLADAATTFLRKREEAVRRLWGVPPFCCTNLGGDDGELRHLLAQETEQTLLKRRGAFVVELDYAYAIAEARKLAGIEQPIRRLRPWFLLGEYRHEASDSGRKLALSLAVYKDESPAQRWTLDPLPMDEAIAKLHARVAAGANAADFSVALDNPVGEIKSLDAVRREYQKAGDAETEIALAETSLLLVAGDQHLRNETASLLGRLAWQEWRQAEELPPPKAPPAAGSVSVRIEGSKPPEQIQREYERALLRAMNHAHRGLNHANTAADNLPAPPPPDQVPKNAPRLPAVQYGHPTPTPRPTSSDALKLLTRPLHVARARLALRMAPIHAHNGEWGEVHMIRELPPADRQAAALRLILELKDYPRPEDRIPHYVLNGMAMMTGWAPEEDERFLKQVEAIDHPAIPAAVRNAREQLARQAEARKPVIIAPSADQRPQAAKPADPPTDSNVQVVFRPLSLPWRNNAAARCELCLPAGLDADLFCSSGQILLMKNKGEAKLIWEGNLGLNFRHFVSTNALACYDGKYAWIPASLPLKSPHLVVVDPQIGKAMEVTHEHGLPEGPVPIGRQPVLATAPLSPGKALLVGSFGQTWLAIATFDPDNGSSVKVIHECVEQAIAGDREQWRSPKLAFEPHYVATLSGKLESSDKTEQRVIVGRAAAGGAFAHPLLVNPESNEVQVLTADYAPFAGGSTFVYEGAMYASVPSRKGRSIWRVGFPDFQPKLVADQPVKGSSFNSAIGMEPGRVHLVHDRWYAARTWDEPLTPLRGTLPAKSDVPIAIMRSNHYGWIVRTLNSEAYAVEFPDHPYNP